MLKKFVPEGRSRWKYRRRSFLTRRPRAASAALSRWATVRMLSRRERSLVKGASWRAWVGRVRTETFSATC